jgi:hypothetical protein
MTHAALIPLLGREFDDFLFASIGEDRNGTALSVLSALARLDVDPWRETASLARMPRKKATERLAALIATAPLGLATALPAASIAARLIALLPQVPNDRVAAPEILVKVAAVTPLRLVMTFGFVAILLAGCYIFAGHPTTGGGPNSAAATTEVGAPR